MSIKCYRPLSCKILLPSSGHYVKMFLFSFITNDQRDNARWILWKKSFVFSGVMKVVRGWDGWTCRGLKTNQSFCDKSRDKEKLPERFKIKSKVATFSVVLHRVPRITFFFPSFLLSDFMRELFRVQRAFILIPPCLCSWGNIKTRARNRRFKAVFNEFSNLCFLSFQLCVRCEITAGFSFPPVFILHVTWSFYHVFVPGKNVSVALLFHLFSSHQMAWNDAIRSHRVMNDDGFLQ